MCKVDVLTEDYGLDAPGSQYDSLDDYLGSRWVGDDGRSASGYRTLTEWFNLRLLETIYRENGRSLPRTHITNEYRLIRGEASIDRTDLAADLEGDGLDIDELEKLLVSHGTIRFHLKNCLDVEKNYTQSRDREIYRKNIETTKHLAGAKVGRTIEKPAASGELPLADDAELSVTR